MTLGWRRVYYLSAICVFFIGAPLLVLFALGYRLNWNYGQIQQSGAISITTDPRGAEVRLDNAPLPKNTPLRITNVLPGEYDITITKTGFFSYRQTVTVLSGQSTNIQNLVLFHGQPSIQPIWSGQELLSSLSPDNGLLSVIDRNEDLCHLSVINLNNSRRQTLNLPLGFSAESISWSNDNKNILLAGQMDESDHFYLYNLSDFSLTDLATITPLPIEQAWLSAEQFDIIFAASPDRLFSIDLYRKQIDTIWIGQVSDFLPIKTGGYFIGLLNSKARLMVYDPTIGPPEILMDLSGRSYRFWPGPDHWFGLENNDTHQLTVNQYPDASRLIQTPLDYTGQFIKWDRAGQRVLFGDGHELFSYRLTTDDYQLITRQIEAYASVMWHPVGTAMLMVDHDRLQAFNLVNGEITDRQALFEKPNLQLLGLNKSGAVAYLKWSDDDQAVIAAVSIR